MQRVYGVVEDDLVHRIDESAGERGISRAQWIRDSILAYLHRGGEDLETEAVNLRAEAVKLQTLCGEQAQEIAVLKEALAVKDGELVHLQDIEAKSREVMAEATQRWEEIKGLKADLARAKRELDEAKGEAVKARSDAAQAVTALQEARDKALAGQHEADKAMSALKAKDDEVAFLRAHIHQITAELLPKALPEPEKDRKRPWWRIW